MEQKGGLPFHHDCASPSSLLWWREGTWEARVKVWGSRCLSSWVCASEKWAGGIFAGENRASRGAVFFYLHWYLLAHSGMLSHLNRNMRLIPVLVRRGEGFLEGASRCSGHTGGCRHGLSRNLRKPELQHHLHLEQGVQVFFPTKRKIILNEQMMAWCPVTKFENIWMVIVLPVEFWYLPALLMNDVTLPNPRTIQ